MGFVLYAIIFAMDEKCSFACIVVITGHFIYVLIIGHFIYVVSELFLAVIVE